MQQEQQPMTLASDTGVAGQQALLVGTQTNAAANYKHRQSKALGLTLIICGALSIVFNIVDLVAYTEGYHKLSYRHMYYGFSTMGVVGHGFWCGVLCIIAGGLGVGASKSKSRCTIIGFMVLSIIAACLCLGQLLCAIIGVIMTSHSLRYGSVRYYHYDDRYPTTTPGYSVLHEIRTVIAMESLLLILALINGITGIWASAICCQAVCCTPTPVTYGIVQYVPMNVYNQQSQQMPVTVMVAAASQYPAQPGQQVVGLPSYSSQPTGLTSSDSNPPAYGAEFQATGGYVQDNTGLPEKH